jgi:hypothetical protein
LQLCDAGPEIDTVDAGRTAAMNTQMARVHLEAPLHVTGRITVDGQDFTVACPGWRDHSAGVRNWGAALSGRYWAGFLGESFVCASAYYLGGDRPQSHGYVLTGETMVRATGVDFVVGVEDDGIGCRYADVALELESGETLSFRCDVVDSFVFQHREMLDVGHITTAVSDDGRRGSGDLEVINNARDGRRVPTYSTRAASTDGVSAR